MVKLLCVWRSCQHEAATEGFGKSAECETSWLDSVRFSSDSCTLPAFHLLHLAAEGQCLCTSSGRSRGMLPQPAEPPGQTLRQSHPHQHLLSFPLLLGQTALEEGCNRRRGGKALKIAAVQSNRVHLSQPVKCVQSQNGGSHYKSSGWSLMLFSRACL